MDFPSTKPDSQWFKGGHDSGHKTKRRATQSSKPWSKVYPYWGMVRSPSICNEKNGQFLRIPDMLWMAITYENRKCDHGTAIPGLQVVRWVHLNTQAFYHDHLKRFLNIVGKPWKTPKATGANHQIFLIQWRFIWYTPFLNEPKPLEP